MFISNERQTHWPRGHLPPDIHSLYDISQKDDNASTQGEAGRAQLFELWREPVQNLRQR